MNTTTTTVINSKSIADLFVSAMNIMYANTHGFSIEGDTIVSVEFTTARKEQECYIHSYDWMQETLDKTFEKFQQRDDITNLELYVVKGIIKQVHGDIGRLVFDYCARYNREGDGQVLTYDGDTVFSRDYLDDLPVPETSGLAGHVLEYIQYHFPIMSEIEKEQLEDELDWGPYVSIENGDEVDTDDTYLSRADMCSTSTKTVEEGWDGDYHYVVRNTSDDYGYVPEVDRLKVYQKTLNGNEKEVFNSVKVDESWTYQDIQDVLNVFKKSDEIQVHLEYSYGIWTVTSWGEDDEGNYTEFTSKFHDIDDVKKDLGC